MKIEIKNRWTGAVIFSHDSEENSMRITVEAAIEAKANLSRANLSRADLSRADLSRANLSRADLSGANLRDADLSDADLSGADLSGANLRDADLSGANIDFSTGWAFACVCSRFTVGISFIRQTLAHLASLKCDDPEAAEIREKILPYAQKSHRAGDLGLIEGEAGK